MEFFVFDLDGDGRNMAIAKDRVINMIEVFDDVEGVEGWGFATTDITWINSKGEIQVTTSVDRITKIMDS